jgi:hypothetical protein
MKIIDKARKAWPFHQEAAPSKTLGRAIVKQTTRPAGYVNRQITPELMAENRGAAPVQSALTMLNRLCFLGFDFVLKPMDDDEGEAVQKKIDEAKTEIKRNDARIGRVGKQKNVGTLGLCRGAFLEGCTFRQSVVEYATKFEEGWIQFSDVQLLPGTSFSTAPPTLAGNERYVSDKILPGIVFDSGDDLTRFFQGHGMGRYEEIGPENVLYLEDASIPDDTSMMRAVTPTIEAWKEVRRIAMLTEGRVGVPNEIAQLDAKDLVALTGAGVEVNISDLRDYAEDLVVNQGFDSAKVSPAGLRLQYPNIPIPLDPWEADQYLKVEILNFFFGKDITEQLSQAISISASPAKALLDARIASERELWGRPFEALWNLWLELNGFEFTCELAWWDWTPDDQEAEAKAARDDLIAGIITINEAREKRGYAPLGVVEGPDGEEIAERDLLYAEIKARKGGQSSDLPGPEE